MLIFFFPILFLTTLPIHFFFFPKPSNQFHSCTHKKKTFQQFCFHLKNFSFSFWYIYTKKFWKQSISYGTDGLNIWLVNKFLLNWLHSKLNQKFFYIMPAPFSDIFVNDKIIFYHFKLISLYWATRQKFILLASKYFVNINRKAICLLLVT